MSLRVVFVIIVLFPAMLAGAMWSATRLPSYHDCKTNGSEQDANGNSGNTNRLIPKAPVVDNTFWDCEGFVTDKNGNAITAIATVVLTVATGLLGIIAYLQFAAAKNQARPYVFVLAKEIVEWAPGGPMRIKVVMENLGVTPAYSVEWAGMASIEAIQLYREKRFLRKKKFMELTAGLPHSVSPLAKEPVWSVDEIEASEFTPEILNGIYGGQLGIYSYSRVWHRDVFGGKYTAESCHYIGLNDIRAMIDIRRQNQTVVSDRMHVILAQEFNHLT